MNISLTRKEIIKKMEKEKLKHSKKTKNNISKALMGKKNPAFKDGRRSYRRVAGLKPNDGKMVHHKDNKSTNNKPSNLQVLKNKGPERSKHEKSHHREANFKGKGSGRKKVKRGYIAKRKAKGGKI